MLNIVFRVLKAEEFKILNTSYKDKHKYFDK